MICSAFLMAIFPLERTQLIDLLVNFSQDNHFDAKIHFMILTSIAFFR